MSAGSEALPFNVFPVRVLGDSKNFAYVLECKKSGQTAVVDVGDAEVILAFLKEKELEMPSAILTTHHHWDHAGGNQKLRQALEEAGGFAPRVYGESKVEALTDEVTGGEVINVGFLWVAVHQVPCHTVGHVLYAVGRESWNRKSQKKNVAKEQSAEKSARENPGCVFTGDTLFIAGCGRFFEGQPKACTTLSARSLRPCQTTVRCGSGMSTP